ncbi:hypothetical protein IVA80_10190 [Bradyrhizobium sp. 139]|uniref:hypothetical protein n=1 Tax=Bradyrhizobium sp. 139 TaxID=2782616 RepID=UPI001FFA3064|nr:hypothetical protein [Bradyrhizobium sp. 139]MCK1741229.1 hypothetical protein [Bradyrhizobium sp. 139]
MEAEVGMLVVETIAKIRRAYFVHGRSIKAICRELGVSRKVVRKVRDAVRLAPAPRPARRNVHHHPYGTARDGVRRSAF